MDDEYLQTLEFVAFDTETTGLWAPANRIVELGAIKFRLGEMRAETFQTLVNPERPIPLDTVNIHGITDTMVRDADTAAVALPQFLEFCGPDSILIAHNALFDISFVGCELDRANIPLPQNKIFDTVDIYRRYHPGLPSYSLLSLARHFQIARSQNHRAADDAALVWRLFLEASEKFPYVQGLKQLLREFPTYTMTQWEGETRELPEEFADFRLAMEEDLPLEIVYQTGSQPPRSRVIRPNRVYFHRSRFYISAFCEATESERTFRLDRVRSFRLLR